MTRTKKTGIYIAVLLLVIIGGKIFWDQMFPSATVRYRVTVEVDTPEGVRSGSSVIEVSITRVPTLSEGGIRYGMRGEAVTLDLPNGKTLFALLSGNGNRSSYDYSVYLAQDVFPNPDETMEKLSRVQGYNEYWRKATKSKNQVILSSEQMPKLVQFRNIDDPNSVELVDPNNLAASFGKGVRLKQITVQATDDAVTMGIDKKIPPPMAKGFYGRPALINGVNILELIGSWEFKRGIIK